MGERASVASLSYRYVHFKKKHVGVLAHQSLDTHFLILV